MKVSLLFCQFVYEKIMGKPLPKKMPFSQAGKIAAFYNRKQFDEYYEKFRHGKLDAEMRTYFNMPQKGE